MAPVLDCLDAAQRSLHDRWPAAQIGKSRPSCQRTNRASRCSLPASTNKCHAASQAAGADPSIHSAGPTSSSSTCYPLLLNEGSPSYRIANARGRCILLTSRSRFVTGCWLGCLLNMSQCYAEAGNRQAAYYYVLPSPASSPRSAALGASYDVHRWAPSSPSFDADHPISAPRPSTMPSLPLAHLTPAQPKS